MTPSLIELADACALVTSFEPGSDGEAAKSKDLVLALLEWSVEPFSRHVYTPGHITCTGLVFSPDRKHILLVHHGRLDRWLLPGGHVEPEDRSLPDAAKREVLEETGAILAPASATLAGIDVHPIPSNGKEPLHLHHDLIFAWEAAARETQCSEESRAVAWCGLDEFDRYQLPGSITRSALRVLSNV